MHSQPRMAQRLLHGIPWRKKSATSCKFKLTTAIVFCLILTTVFATLLVTNPVLHALAAAQSAIAINGTPGNQPASLTWTTHPNAPSYIVENPDLVTGQVQPLPNVIPTTSFPASSLAT